MEILIGIGVIVVVLFLFFILVFNGIVNVTNKVNEAFSTMDVYLKKRYNLLPNLIDTVKGYAGYEKETLENITNARAQATQSNDTNNIVRANTEISNGLQKILIVAENYPELKSNIGFLDLQKDLKQIEEDIANARKYYNGSVREYNNYISMFPNLIVAKLLNKKEQVFFAIEETERESIKMRM